MPLQVLWCKLCCWSLCGTCMVTVWNMPNPKTLNPAGLATCMGNHRAGCPTAGGRLCMDTYGLTLLPGCTLHRAFHSIAHIVSALLSRACGIAAASKQVCASSCGVQPGCTLLKNWRDCSLLAACTWSARCILCLPAPD